MVARGLTVALFGIALAAPAFADCAADLEALKGEVIESETGAATGGMPATKHQEEVLEGSQQAGQGAATGAGTGEQSAMPASPHQEQALGAMAGDGSASSLMSEATKLAEAGDEAGCMEKVGEVKNLLGMN